MVTLENEYYLRTILLLCEGGAYISKQIIGRELPKYGGDLDALLKLFKNKLKHEFHQKQMDKLFPNNGYDKTDVDKWDIQMFVGVMLLLFRETLNDEEKHHLREMKLIRHEVLAHSPSASLYIEKYEEVQKQLGDAIDTLAKGFDQTVKDRCTEYINTYASGPLYVKSAIERLQEAKDTDDLFQEVISVIRETQEELTTEIHTAESNIRQDFFKGLKSVELNMHQTVKGSTKTLLKGFRDIESDVKDTKQHISKEVNSVGDTVRSTENTLIKKIEEMKKSEIECNTFKALLDMKAEVKKLQELLMQNMKQCSHDRLATEWQHASAEGLSMKSNELDRRLHTYDMDACDSLEDQAIQNNTREDNALKQALPVHNDKALPVAAIDSDITDRVYLFSLKSIVLPTQKPSWSSSCDRSDRDMPLYGHRDKDQLLVVIDIGTTYSGYAYSFNRTYPRVSGISVKAPTAVLFDSWKNFHSFGYEAEDVYNDLAAYNEHRDWLFFRRFKMKLCTDKVDMDTMLQADNGEEMAAIDVFAAVFKYFDHHLRTLMIQQGLRIVFDRETIRWVITVPAIWTYEAAHFMLNAAKTTGAQNVSIAYEAEVASIYCQTIPVGFNQQEDHRFTIIHSGKKYMVINLGGGTVDFTVIENQRDCGMRILYKATGGAWDGTKVDNEYYQLIMSVVGKEVFMKFSDENKSDYLRLQREFEEKKQTDQSSGRIRLRVPNSLVRTYLQVKNKDINTALKESIYDGKITWKRDELKVDADVWNGLFKPYCENIVGHISDLLDNVAVQGTNVFLMVGGLSNCKIIQNAVKSAFPSVKIVIPENADLAVLKGAVIYGNNPPTTTSRVAKYTYGISISPLFDRLIHPESRRVSINGKDRCRDVFKKYVSKGEDLFMGDVRSGEHITIWPRQKEIKLKLYASEHQNPMYVDEDGTRCIGNIVAKLPQSDEQRTVNVKMMFGRAELKVEVTELSEGRNYLAMFECE